MYDIVRGLVSHRRARFAWLGIALLAVFMGLTSAAVLGSTGLWPDDPPNAGAGGREVLSKAPATGPIRVVSVRASAFSTTIELRLNAPSPLARSDTIAVEAGAMRTEPRISQLHLSGARVVSPTEIVLLLSGGPIERGRRNLIVTIDDYVLVHEAQGERVAGPWVMNTEISGDVPKAELLPTVGPLVTELGSGLRFVIDDAQYDGYVLRVGYHIDGDTVGLRMFGAPPPSSGGAVPLPLLGPAPAQREQVDVRFQTSMTSLELLLPVLVRSSTERVAATLTRTTGGAFVGTGTIAGESVTFRADADERGLARISVTAAPGTRISFTGSVSNVSLRDESDAEYSLEKAGGTVASFQNAAESVFSFSRPVPAAISTLRLSFTGYEVAISDSVAVTLTLK